VSHPTPTTSTKPARSTGAVVAALVLFFPLGLYWMWQGHAWSPKTRWIVTGVTAVIVIAAAGSNSNPPATNTASDSAQVQPSAVGSVAPSVTPSTPETEAQKAAAAKAAAVQAAADKAAAAKAAADKAAENGPPNEQALNAAVTTGKNAFDGTDNEIRQGQAQSMRNQALCAAVPTFQATNWVGSINSISTNGGGKGVLELQIGPDTKIATWNNVLSDVSDNTLIPQTSPIYGKLANLSEGDKVTFSGRFFHDGDNCLEEQSLTKVGKMDTPNFVFRFTSLDKS
jgi:hypothetical protein